jgi:ribonucleotide monophosphatase NagD (HAD superfamily)
MMGKKYLESAVECLKELKSRQKFVLLMSNTELNAVEAAAGIEKIGGARWVI